MQLHRRYAFLRLGQQIQSLKPHRQRQFGGIENGAGYDRSLAMALVALLQLSGVELTAFVVTVVRAYEAVRPAPFVKCIEALLFCAVVFEEFAQAEVFLELNVIASHVDTFFLFNNLDRIL